jgi:hypothetical protein
MTYPAFAAESARTVNPDVLGHDGSLLVKGHVLLELLTLLAPRSANGLGVETYVHVVGDDGRWVLYDRNHISKLPCALRAIGTVGGTARVLTAMVAVVWRG